VALHRLAAPRGPPPAAPGDAHRVHPGSPWLREHPVAEEVDEPGLLVPLVRLCMLRSNARYRGKCAVPVHQSGTGWFG
jgi:hypothetical protein